MNPDEINPLVRIAEALESIAKSMERAVNPLFGIEGHQVTIISDGGSDVVT